jgi:hypothetical protein
MVLRANSFSLSPINAGIGDLGSLSLGGRPIIEMYGL